MPKYPTLIQLKTVITPIGVAVTVPRPVSLDLSLVPKVDVKATQPLSINISITYTVSVSP